MSDIEILYSKDGFEFSRLKSNHYKLDFYIENKNIFLKQIVDFGLINLIYKLNSDVYEKMDLQIIDDNHATLNLLMKHLFEDLGLPQRYTYIHIEKSIDEMGNVTFRSSSIEDRIPEGMPANSLLMPLQEVINECVFINPHKIHFITNVRFHPKMTVPSFAEKMVGLILNKIFKRVKSFIENA
jgi:hypothetical protein